MEDLVKHIAERIDINDGAGIEPDLMQCNISHDVHSFLELEGDTWQERKGFLQDLLKEFKQQEELHTISPLSRSEYSGNVGNFTRYCEEVYVAHSNPDQKRLLGYMWHIWHTVAQYGTCVWHVVSQYFTKNRT